MRLAVVGVGGAGSRITNRVLDVERASGRNLTGGNSLLVDAEEPELDATPRVPAERRVLIGDVHRAVEDGPVEGDLDRAAAVAREERHEIVRAFDAFEFHAIDGVLVVAGLGGATGGGTGAVVVDQLQAICDEPVYAVGVLPAESEGREPALTAARSLRSFVEAADNVVLFDNEAWASAEEVTHGDYGRPNVALARRLVTLFGAGEIDGGAAPETRVDPSDVMRTLDTGGVSSIGFASTDLPRRDGLWSWISDRVPWTSTGTSTDTADETTDEAADEPTDAVRINRLVRRAARSKLTLPCEVSSAERALVLLSGPSAALSRKGFESGRYWLERETDTVDVMAGDEPHDRASALTAVVLLSNVTAVPRIDALQAQAVGDREPPPAPAGGADDAAASANDPVEGSSDR